MYLGSSAKPQRDPRFVNTLRQILKTPEPSGLTANVGFIFLSLLLFLMTFAQNLVFRYDVNKSDNGV